MPTYEIRPREPYTWEDIYLDGLNFNNAEIVKIVNGMVVERYPYTPWLEERLKPKLPKDLFQETAIFYDGREHVIERDIYEKTFRSGCNPFKQAVMIIVDERQPITVEDTVRAILEEWKILKNNSKNREWLRKLIAWMTREQYLVYQDGILKEGIRRLPLGAIRIPIKVGYNPILNEMLHAIKMKGTLTKKNLASYMITELNWIENDPVTGKSAMDLLDYYLKYLLKNGYIEEVKEDTYKFIKPLEPY